MANAGMNLVIQDSIIYSYNASRNKFLSSDRAFVKTGIKNRNVTNQYLRTEDGSSTLAVGEPIQRNATIVGITALCETAATWVLQVYKKGVPSPIVTLPIASDLATDNTIDIDVDAGDILLLRVSGTDIPFPRGILELAWRL